MKKFLSFVIVLVMLMSLTVTAFAAGSPTVGPGGGDNGDIAVVDPSNPDGPKVVIPAKAIKTVTIDQADKLLSAEDAKAFKAAYDEAMAMEDCKVYKCFWLFIDEELVGEDFPGISENCALAYKFSCPGEGVKLYVNGNEMKTVKENGKSYTAYLTELGAVTITCEK